MPKKLDGAVRYMLMDVEAQDMGSGLSVFLLSFRGGFSAFPKILRALEEEGMEILAANFVSGEVAFITVHCLVIT